jgi:hypothetical protein
MKKLTLKRVASVSCLIFSVAMRRRLLDIFTLWLRPSVRVLPFPIRKSGHFRIPGGGRAPICRGIVLAVVFWNSAANFQLDRRATQRLWRARLRALNGIERIRIDVAAVSFAGSQTLVEYVTGAVG